MNSKIVVCASGEGSNFEALVESAREGRLKAEIVGLIVSRSGVGALARAERLGVPTAVISPKAFAKASDWDQAMVHQIQAWSGEWIALAGFLCRVGPQMLATFPKRIVNSHPSLLPDFGGPGMYGDRVHAAVLAAGRKETGITIHVIDGEYDRGQIVAQTRVEVREGDTPALLATRVKSHEVRFYPKVLNDLVTGQTTGS